MTYKNSGLKEEISEGILNAVIYFISILVLSGAIILCGYFVATKFTYTYNTTDSKESFERSGLTIHVDNRTGCHYLLSSSGSLIKRTDKNDNHICEGE